MSVTCNAFFGYKEVLERHLNIHQGRKFTCDLCNKEYAQKGSMESHKRVNHFKKKRTTKKCSLCDYETRQNRELNCHFQSKHSTVKFPCTMCKYEGPSQRNLKLHIKVKHYKKNYKCSLCPHTSTREGNLKIHYQNKHILKSNFTGMEF